MVRMAFRTEKPPNGVSDCKLSVSSIFPTFFIRISLVFLKATGTSPKSMTSGVGIRVRFTVVVRTCRKSDLASASVLSVGLK